MSKVIRISDAVWKELQLRAHSLEDTPDSVLRRELKIDTEATKGSGVTLFQLLWVYLNDSSRKQKKHAMDEIKRRFTWFGWNSPKAYTES